MTSMMSPNPSPEHLVTLHASGMVDEPVAKAAKRPGTKPKGPINKIVPMDPKNGVVQ